MSTIEMLYLWMAAACLLAFIAGFSSGVWVTLHILHSWSRQWKIDREQPVSPTMMFTRPDDHPELEVVSTASGDSFER